MNRLRKFKTSPFWLVLFTILMACDPSGNGDAAREKPVDDQSMDSEDNPIDVGADSDIGSDNFTDTESLTEEGLDTDSDTREDLDTESETAEELNTDSDTGEDLDSDTDGAMTSIAGNPRMAKRCIRSAHNSGYVYENCPDGGGSLLYSFLTEDWGDISRNPNPGGWYCAYNGSATNGDPSYQVGVKHNWEPFQHVQQPLNHFWWSGSADNWIANIKTTQWPDSLIYSKIPGFIPEKQYVANGIEEYSHFGMTKPEHLDSLTLQGRVKLMHTQNPDVRIVAKFAWKRVSDPATYIIEFNLWSSKEEGGWRTNVPICGYSNHEGAHMAYVIMGAAAHNFPALSTSGNGTFYNIDWAGTIDWLQNTSCASVKGPNPCLPADATENIEMVKTGFMTERNGYGEVHISIEDMDVLQ